MAEKAEIRSVAAPGEPQGGVLIMGLVLLALALLVTFALGKPPEPKPKDAPATEFSAGRAGDVLRDLVGDGTPHPLGSAANAQVRERVMAHLRALGYAPEVQEAATCQSGWGCARVWNVLARLPGQQRGKAVLLIAHYDSVPAGPGASDDLTGVAAVLEIARVLKAGPPPRNPVLILVDDGEEAGLLGARAFAESSPAAREVGAVVNLEARGTAGPSLMFQTSVDDAWLVDAWASRASRPFTSSLFPTVYRLLPNDTDLTVFLRRDVPGINFAFIDHPSWYHTPEDTLEHASPASLQHHGDNALAAVRGLAAADLAAPPAGGAVFFDFLHLFVVRWPAGLSWLLGLVALALCLASASLAHRKGFIHRRSAASWGAVGLGLAVPLLSFVLTVILAIGLQALLARAFPSAWVARPLPAMIAFWLLPLALTAALAWPMGRQKKPAGVWAGVWAGWSLLGLLTSVTLPGLSYLFLPPALVAGILGVLAFASGGSAAAQRAAWLVPILLVGLIWFPVLVSLYTGLGLFGLLATSILLAIVFSTLIPLVRQAGPLGRRWLPLAAAGVAVIAAVVALMTPANSTEVPRDIIISLYQDADASDARWLVNSSPPLPPALRQAASFGQKPVPAFPWLPPRVTSFAATAPRLDVPGPELKVLEDSVVEGKRHLRLQLTSPRGAPVGSVAVPAEARIESIKIDGQAFPTTEHRAGPLNTARDWKLFSNLTLPPGGTEVEVVLGSTQPTTWYVIDRSFGLPPSAQPLLAARPKDAVTMQDGDTVVVSRKVKV